MPPKSLLIINFITGGGIKQFTEHLLRQLDTDGIAYEYKETRSLKELLRLCGSGREVVFCVNNIRIYVVLLLLRSFAPTLILHDHKARVGATRVERLLIACVHLFASRFRKIIIHSEDSAYLGLNNVVARRMPFHAPAFPYVDKVRILYFGRIEPYKNLPFLVDLAERTGETTEYFIAGSGELAPELKSRMNRAPNVSLLNAYLDERTVKLLFSWCDYLILPYSDITQTGLVDQAGYFSKPVIVSNIDGFKRYFGRGFCIRLDIKNVQSAATAISSLPTRQAVDYQRMSEESRSNFLDSVAAWSDYVQELVH